MDRPRVAGSLWSVPAANQQAAAVKAAEAGLKVLHWDVADGSLGPSGGFAAHRAGAIAAAAGTKSEAHLMLAEPLVVIDDWASWCEMVIVHIESRDWRKSLDRISELGAIPGLAVSPTTEMRLIPADVSAVLVMSVNPGFAGSSFEAMSFDRVSTARAVAGPERLVGLDGGVCIRHAEPARSAGAQWLVSGTDLFNAESQRAWISECEATLSTALRP